jgi:hypothetical protein
LTSALALTPDALRTPLTVADELAALLNERERMAA